MTPTRDEAIKLLRAALDDPAAEFRDGQWEAIEGLIAGRGRQLVVQRTGWGKSIVYFLATRVLRDAGAGPTLLVSPLLALMRNQIEMAARIGVSAVTINSDNTASWEEIEEQVRTGEVDVLLVSPERLANEKFMRTTLLPIASSIGLFVIDEAHCISDWGHDFRPDYQRIRRVLQALPSNVRVLATTATANDRVVNDIQEQLGSGADEQVGIQRGSLERASLRLQNVWLPDQVARYAWLADHLKSMTGSGIIYVLTRRDAARLAAWLRDCDIDAWAYMGGGPDNAELEQKLLRNELKVLVATSALGMGFDKPDLAFVVHFQRPASVVHYYQQVGRAGRGLPEARGIMLSGAEDRDIGDYFIRSAFPAEAQVWEVLNHLRGCGEDGLSIRQLESKTNLERGKIEQVLRLLAVQSPAPVVKERSRWCATPVDYEIPTERIARLRELRETEQERMEAYLHHPECLMAFLRGDLDDHEGDAPCGRCANCAPEFAMPTDVLPDTVERAAAFLGRSELPIEPRRTWGAAGDALQEYGWKGTIAASLRLEYGRCLAFWGETGTGAAARRGKEERGTFSDELVRQLVEMIDERWKPDPAPTWVTCVPSLRTEELVPDFARRVAEALGLPFRESLRQVRDTERQKDMANSVYQAGNVAGAYEVIPEAIDDGPVLLVDDVISSRWTITILGALLREAGAGPVYPVALATR